MNNQEFNTTVALVERAQKTVKVGNIKHIELDVDSIRAHLRFVQNEIIMRENENIEIEGMGGQGGAFSLSDLLEESMRKNKMNCECKELKKRIDQYESNEAYNEKRLKQLRDSSIMLQKKIEAYLSKQEVEEATFGLDIIRFETQEHPLYGGGVYTLKLYTCDSLLGLFNISRNNVYDLYMILKECLFKREKE